MVDIYLCSCVVDLAVDVALVRNDVVEEVNDELHPQLWQTSPGVDIAPHLFGEWQSFEPGEPHLVQREATIVGVATSAYTGVVPEHPCESTRDDDRQTTVESQPMCP